MTRAVLICTLATVLSGTAAVAQTATTKPDNTRANKDDRKRGAPTADQQKENKSDRDITQQIRRSVTKDKTLSTYAKNVKIITQNGEVTLRGPVRSEDEKQAIEAKASEVAGAAHVKNEITIAPKEKKRKTD